MKKKTLIQGFIIIIFVAITFSSLYFIDINKLIEYIKELPIFYMNIAFIALVALQIILAFLPGEPLELASGYLLGSWQGTIVCLIGSMIGTWIVYILVKIFKRSIIDVMFKNEKVEEVRQLMSSKKGMTWLFILFLIPGTPKDIMTYVASLSDIELKNWLILTTIGRIPSIVTSTFLSCSLKNGEIFSAIMIFVVTIILTVLGIVLYKRIITLHMHNRVLQISNKE